MRAIEVQTAVDIDAPPEAVWPRLVDWENLSGWMKEGTEFKVTSAQREGVGVEATATIRVAGVKTKDPIRVTKWEPPMVLEIEHLGWVKGTGLMRCFRTHNGTHLFWLERLVPPWSFLGAIGIRMFKPILHKTFADDLQRLKALVETTDPGRFPGK